MKESQYEIIDTLEGRGISFSADYNEIIEYLPDDKISIIEFNNDYNCCLDYLPEQIEIIYFGDKFNQPVNDLPNSLKFISFGTHFTQSINNLPDSLEEIRITQHYDPITIKKLPANLKVFTVVDKMKRVINYEEDYEEHIYKPVEGYYEKYTELEKKFPNIKFYY